MSLAIEINPDTEWEAYRNCEGLNEDAFISPVLSETEVAMAKAVCRGCVVKEDCLQQALRDETGAGVIGGLDEIERKRYEMLVAGAIELAEELAA